MSEYDILNALLEAEPNLKGEGLENWSGYFVHYNEVIKAVCTAWDGVVPCYDSDPFELIYRLIDERDELKSKLNKEKP